jgi:cytochrome c
MYCGKLSLLLIITTLAPVVAQAQGPTYKIGSTPSEAEIQAWDIAIGPSGKELPPGSGTAVAGAEVYLQKCAVCHGPTGAEVMYPGGYPAPLVGGKGTLADESPLRTVGSYWAFATSIWDYINRAMPPNPRPMPPYWIYAVKDGKHVTAEGDDASPLTHNEVYAVTAWLLYRNDIIEQDDVIDARSLPKVRMPNRDGFLPANPGEWYPKQQVGRHVKP